MSLLGESYNKDAEIGDVKIELDQETIERIQAILDEMANELITCMGNEED